MHALHLLCSVDMKWYIALGRTIWIFIVLGCTMWNLKICTALGRTIRFFERIIYSNV